MPFIKGTTLNYPITAVRPIRIMQETRDPLPSDYKEFDVGDEWTNKILQTYWILIYKDGVHGVWREIGGSTTGDVLVKYVYSSTSDLVTCTTVMPRDDTIPQNTEGDEVLTLTIKPQNANNLLTIKFNTSTQYQVAAPVCALFQDNNVNALRAVAGYGGSSTLGALYLSHTLIAGTTSDTTFKIRVGPDNAGGTVYLNGISASRYLGGVSSTQLEVWEINV